MNAESPIEQIKELSGQARLEVKLAVASHNAEVFSQKIVELESKLAKAVEALRGSRETILELVNSRWSEAEGTDEDWVGDIDTIISEIKGSK